MENVINPPQRQPDALSDHLRLAWDLARRDLAAKYRRSVVGMLWLVLTPLALLGIYSLIFGRIFGVKWQAPGLHAGDVGFVLPFFVGLSIYLLLSDVVNSSSVLFSGKRTFVVKSPFPLWVLWASNLMRAGVHGGVSLALVLVLAVFQQRLTLTGVVWLVPVLLNCIVFMAALSLLLAALGPFIGDISEAMRLLLRVLFYATPVSYPLSMVPQPYRDWMWLNPLTCMVELLRNPVVFGEPASMGIQVSFLAGTAVVAVIAGWVFARVKGVISDVV